MTERLRMHAPWILLLALAAGSALAAPPAPDLAPVKKWIEQQRNVRTIQADFVQTRALRTLKNPVAAKGRFWFEAPARFRWQIGDPPKTIALGNAKTLYLIQPGKKTADKSPMDQFGGKARPQGLGMMNFPMAADFEEFQRGFEVLSVKVDGTSCRLEGLPRDAQARRFLAKIILDFDTKSGQLLAFEAVTREGSSMRSEFRNVIINGRIDPGVFNYDLTGYRVSDAKS